MDTPDTLASLSDQQLTERLHEIQREERSIPRAMLGSCTVNRIFRDMRKLKARIEAEQARRRVTK